MRSIVAAHRGAGVESYILSTLSTLSVVDLLSSVIFIPHPQDNPVGLELLFCFVDRRAKQSI